MKFSIHSLFAFAQSNSIQSADAQLIRQLIAETRSMKTIAERMKLVSGKLLGAAYLRQPLIGSPTEAEALVTRMDGFDCVTFLETVLVLARAKSVDDFAALLRKARYRNGEIAYQQRFHYATDWANHLIQLGWLSDMTAGEATIFREKTLDFVAGIAPTYARLRYFPKRELAAVSRWLKDGDLILFASGRKGLDVSHAGMIVRSGEQVLMRHATRSHKQVIEQDLAEFFKTLPMNGFMIFRPKEI
ncbi:MAG: N-acetylmuramoyl-L-alanine amidase-like domain-containing protein [Blastocatellia bacterium]